MLERTMEGSKLSMRKHYERAARFDPHAAKFLIAPYLPFAVQHIWTLWLDLHHGRTVGMAINPISWEAMAAYNALMQQQLSPREIRLIQVIEDEYLKSVRTPTTSAAPTTST